MPVTVRSAILELYMNEVYLGQSEGQYEIRGFPLSDLYYWPSVRGTEPRSAGVTGGDGKGASIYNPVA